MKKVIAFGASNSKKSINQHFAKTAAGLLDQNQIEVEALDLNDYEMPIFGIDREMEEGIPQLAKDFKQKMIDADGIIISFAEHNSSYSTAFKNIFDWISRIEQDIWHNTPMLLLSTSPGGRGGMTVLQSAYDRFSRSNENVVGKLSLPFFQKNLGEHSELQDEEIAAELKQLIGDLEKKVL